MCACLENSAEGGKTRVSLRVELIFTCDIAGVLAMKWLSIGVLSNLLVRYKKCESHIKEAAAWTAAPLYYCSNVDRSPISAPVACAFNKRRIILPERIFGKPATNSIAPGVAIGPSSRRTWSINAA